MEKKNNVIFYGTVIYLITELGTIIGLWYDFKQQAVIRVKISLFVKKLASFKIRAIQIV
jgi:hypothetical protein